MLNSVRSEILIGMQLNHVIMHVVQQWAQPPESNPTADPPSGFSVTTAVGHAPLQPSFQLPQREDIASFMRNAVSFLYILPHICFSGTPLPDGGTGRNLLT